MFWTLGLVVLSSGLCRSVWSNGCRFPLVVVNAVWFGHVC